MKYGSSAKIICPKCKVIRRGKKGQIKRVRVICESNPRHKQAQG